MSRTPESSSNSEGKTLIVIAALVLLVVCAAFLAGLLLARAASFDICKSVNTQQTFGDRDEIQKPSGAFIASEGAFQRKLEDLSTNHR